MIKIKIEIEGGIATGKSQAMHEIYEALSKSSRFKNISANNMSYYDKNKEYMEFTAEYNKQNGV